jgi:succinyl-CoA synthetase beta subunit
MNIHEYQGKEIFRKYGVPTLRGIPAFSVDEAVNAANSLGGKVWVVKAQIHAGGRGKGGGVKVAKSIEEVRDLAGKILGMNLVTHQTGPGGKIVKRLLIEEGAAIEKEYYAALVIDRAQQRVVLMASSEGGVNIEEVAEKTPEKIHKVAIDPKPASRTPRPRTSRARPAFPRSSCRRRATSSRRSTRSSSSSTPRSSR